MSLSSFILPPHNSLLCFSYTPSVLRSAHFIYLSHLLIYLISVFILCSSFLSSFFFQESEEDQCCVRSVRELRLRWPPNHTTTTITIYPIRSSPPPSSHHSSSPPLVTSLSLSHSLSISISISISLSPLYFEFDFCLFLVQGGQGIGAWWRRWTMQMRPE